MNFGRSISVVLFVCTSALRNSVEGEGEVKLSTDANSSLGWDHCTGHPAAHDARHRCKQPRQGVREKLLCRQCGQFGFSKWDTHPECNVQCCDKNADHAHGMCTCTHYKQKYNKNGWPAGVVGADTAEKCCGRDGHGNAKTLPGGLCGCTDVGAENHYGGFGSDCCSGKENGHGWCIPGDCAKKGEKGRCCRLANDDTDRKESSSCPCFHGGEVPNRNDKVGWENCCAGKKNDLGNACGCIKDAKEELPAGADERDCCSGKLSDDGKHCAAAKCSSVGDAVQGGEHCCSDKKGDDDRCKCIPSGLAVPDDATMQDCCSGRINITGMTCDFLLKGEMTLNNTDAEDACLSKSAASNGKCRCIHAGTESTAADQCCSGEVDGDGKCTCVAVETPLEDGARESNCCSKTASPDGICRCAAPGAPGKKEDCCSGTANSDGFCGCFTEDFGSVTGGQSPHCCGNFYNYDGSKCTCVKSGHAVGSWAPETACCSGKKEGGVCAA